MSSIQLVKMLNRSLLEETQIWVTASASTRASCHRLLQQAGEKLSAIEAQAPVLEAGRGMANPSGFLIPQTIN